MAGASAVPVYVQRFALIDHFFDVKVLNCKVCGVLGEDLPRGHGVVLFVIVCPVLHHCRAALEEALALSLDFTRNSGVFSLLKLRGEVSGNQFVLHKDKIAGFSLEKRFSALRGKDPHDRFISAVLIERLRVTIFEFLGVVFAC